MPCAESTTEAKEELDEYHAHEALDRTCMLMEIVETQLLNHPYIQANLAMGVLADQALLALSELYQLIGSEHL